MHSETLFPVRPEHPTPRPSRRLSLGCRPRSYAGGAPPEAWRRGRLVGPLRRARWDVGRPTVKLPPRAARGLERSRLKARVSPSSWGGDLAGGADARGLEAEEVEGGDHGADAEGIGLKDGVVEGVHGQSLAPGRPRGRGPASTTVSNGEVRDRQPPRTKATEARRSSEVQASSTTSGDPRAGGGAENASAAIEGWRRGDNVGRAGPPWVRPCGGGGGGPPAGRPGRASGWRPTSCSNRWSNPRSRAR